MDKIDLILKYAQNGFPVLPLHNPVRIGDIISCSCKNPECKSIGKHPRIHNGGKGASVNEQIIRDWFTKWPEANVGLLTGSVSGALVLDIDPRNNGDVTFATLEKELGPLPQSLVAHTSAGGHHLYFKHPEFKIKNSSGKLGNGLDIKSDGGYVVAEPSIHATGDPYCFELEPDEFPLVELPHKWLERIKGLDRKTKQPTSIQQNKVIGGGFRNTTLASIAGRLRNEGLEFNEIFTSLIAINKQKCDPPLDATEVQAIAESISRYPAGEEAGKKEKPKSCATLLVELAEECDLFHSPGDCDTECYASIVVDGYMETWLVNSKGFSNWLSKRYFIEYGKAPSTASLHDAICTISGLAAYQGDEHQVAVRLAEYEGVIYLDLANDKWQVVAVDAKEWKVVDSVDIPVRFIRKKGMLALPTPVAGGRIDELRALVNLPDDDSWNLFVGWLVMSFSPSGPYPILAVNGEQGSAKSTLCRFARALIDPNESDLRRPPSNERDLMIAAQNSRVVAFDNLSGIKNSLSDSLCCLATGAAFSTRALYTDDEEKLFRAQRPVIMNGIDELAKRSDLAERTVSLMLPAIGPSQRRDEASIVREFNEMKPRLLGALLRAVSAALKNRDSVKLVSPPRMADFMKWVIAAEESLEWETGTFQAAYDTNQLQAHKGAIESNNVGMAIMRLLSISNGYWKGTMTELHKTLLPLRDKCDDYWPKHVIILGQDVNRLAPNFRALGVQVCKGTDGTGNNRQRWVKFKGDGIL